MPITLSYPGTRKQAQEFDDQQEAIAAAYREANDHTVEVHAEAVGDDEPVLLVRYEAREEPVELAPAATTDEPGSDGS